MYTVVKQAIRKFTVASALFVTLITTVRGHLEHCGQEALVRCAQPLQVLTDSGLTFVAGKRDLDRICPDLKEGIKCIHSYTRRCMSLHQRSHFNKLFHGTGAMVKELCTNGTYQDEYLKFAPCMREVVAENEVCFLRYQSTMEAITNPEETPTTTTTPAPFHHPSPRMNYYSTERTPAVDPADEKIKGVCCSFQRYVECSTHTMRRACGDEAASFSRGFLDRMASSMIKLHCSEYTADKCGLSSAAAAYASWLVLPLLSIILMIAR